MPSISKEAGQHSLSQKISQETDFQTLDGKSLKIDMMRREMKKLRYGENKALDCKYIHLPYTGDEMAMVVLLPNTVTGLLKMEKKIDVQKLNQCIKDVSSQLL
ncbi:hypothetical protein DPMN_055941 [Dreissena polymorpha]|uniref:Serpin domain-containing protein n=1 Tax=Dreissena polymorpha TaxID=45954 RepID=A0A9D4CQU2_DREPO|nr:hypothetical protein DPMN_055941 [Dreissena polymorpha]